MRLYRSFRVHELGFPPDLYSELCAIRPECRGSEDSVVESQPGDAERSHLISRLVDICERNLIPRAKTSGEFGAYIYEAVRHYDQDDLERAPLLLMEVQGRVFRERLARDDCGRVALPIDQLVPANEVASGMFNNIYVVSDPTRQVLAAGHLAGVLFRETAQKIMPSTGVKPLWEVDSSETLPKMVNSVLSQHSQFPHYAIDERPYRYGEPHYRQSDLSRIGAFDIARTFEVLASEAGLIVSKRFYLYCLSKRIVLRVRPARIDPD